jgi:c-di-GMP-binding flagellar brake protein YcgR
MRIVDIGCGGIALLGPADERKLETGITFANCRIDLPETGLVATTLEIRNIAELTTTSGLKQRRLGCSFTNLPGPMVTMIQRYVNMAERNRLSRE